MKNVVPFPRLTCAVPTCQLGPGLRSSFIEGGFSLIVGASRLEELAIKRGRARPSEHIAELRSIAAELLSVDVSLPNADKRSAALLQRTEALHIAITRWLTRPDALDDPVQSAERH